MIIPRYWAEGRAHYKKDKRQITIRRFGWSDTSEEDAQQLADARADEALQRVLSGEKLPRREPKMPYNGADGVPIREEIVAKHGDTIITRNAYGARCLNSPNVLFADIDFDSGTKTGIRSVLFIALVISGLGLALVFKWWLAGAVLVAVAILINSLAKKKDAAGIQTALAEQETKARQRIQDFISQHPDWHVAIYRTPLGMRILALHRTFQPGEKAVEECFAQWEVDPIYARMCLNQKCFRARISPKPWRIGIAEHIRPRPGIWPISQDGMALRTTWVERYEDVAKAFAACKFLETIGSGKVDKDALAVQELHDELCQAQSGLPIA